MVTIAAALAVGVTTAVALSGCSDRRIAPSPGRDGGGTPPDETSGFFSVGGQHGCALFGGGALRCWGANVSGQLGRSSFGDPLDAYSVDLGIGRRATGVFAGLNHTCALLDGGVVKCWGLNSFGQLGLGDEVNRGDGLAAMGDALPEVALGLGRRAAALAVGASATCALLDDGMVKCWGDAYQGALGYGDIDIRGNRPGGMGDNLPTLDLGTRHGRPLRAKQIAAIDYHSFCAILEVGGGDIGDDGGGQDGSSRASGLKCWGSNDYCELAIGTRQGGRGGEPGMMGDNLAFIDLGTTPTGEARRATQVAAGFQFVCVLTHDGKVKCWGDNTGGQLGIGMTGSPRSCLPEEVGDVGWVALPAPAVAIAARGLSGGAGAHACALLTTGEVTCWGENAFGQLGTGDLTAWLSPSPALNFGPDFVPRQLRLGNDYSCAISNEGRVKCWGNDASGQLSGSTGLPRGSVDPGEERLPVLSPTSRGADIRLRGAAVRALAAGDAHTCAALEGGSLKCWGRNAEGQLGLGDRVNRGDAAGQMGDSLPPVELGGVGVRALAAGARHTCAALESGALVCWGANDQGQLGRSDVTELLAPAAPISLSGQAQTVAAGAAFTCALSASGQLTCFGDNRRGQLGRGDSDDHRAEVSVVTLPSPATAVTAGDHHACALLKNGRVACWGGNHQGQLGLGDTVDRTRPVVVDVASSSGMKVVRAVAARAQVTCALLEGGGVTCWGANEDGQLGRGDTLARQRAPAAFVDLGTRRHASALAVGGTFSCALLDTKQAKCWGDNRLQQLGARLTAPAYGDGPSELGDFLPEAYQGGGRTVSALTSGRAHSCAILDTRDVRCWGDNAEGQLGTGDSMSHSLATDPTGVVDLGGEP